MKEKESEYKNAISDFQKKLDAMEKALAEEKEAREKESLAR